MEKVKEVFRGQVYLSRLTGKGCEQRGKRPVLILQSTCKPCNRMYPSYLSTTPLTEQL